MVKPKLALIPASQGTKLYSVLPSNGVGDFAFTRAGSATRINSQGLIETVASGVSRLNYPLIDGVVNGCPSHLLEPQRINLFNYSEDYSQGYWTKTASSTIISDTVISPKGVLNATKLQTNTSSAEHSVLSAGIPIINENSYTVSLFAKASEKTFLFIGWSSAGFGSPSPSFFDLTTGEYLSGTGQTITVTKFPNGWYRFTTTRNATATSSSNNGIRIGLCDSLLTSTTTGQNTTDGIYIWGAQLEQGSYPTSYIPNYGTALGVTRSAETANGAGDASTFNDSEGVLFAEISALADDGTNRAITISDGTPDDRIFITYYAESNGLFSQIISNGVTQVTLSTTLPSITDIAKVLVKYKQNEFSLWVNGFEVATDTLETTPTGLNDLSFHRGTGTLNFYGNTKQIQYFDSALNDSDLEILTSWVSFTDMANGQQYTIE